MSQPGEFGDHLCLVAYSRASGNDIYVHQLGNPVWIVRAVDGREAKRQLHIVYYEWEHYDSLRLIANDDQDIYMGQAKLAVGRPKPKAEASSIDPTATLPRKSKGKGKSKSARFEKQQQRQAKLKAKAMAAQVGGQDDAVAESFQALAI